MTRAPGGRERVSSLQIRRSITPEPTPRAIVTHNPGGKYGINRSSSWRYHSSDSLVRLGERSTRLPVMLSQSSRAKPSVADTRH